MKALHLFILNIIFLTMPSLSFAGTFDIYDPTKATLSIEADNPDQVAGAVLGGAIGATPGLLLLGQVLACAGAGPIGMAICSSVIPYAVGLAAAGGAMGARAGYTANRSEHHVTYYYDDESSISEDIGITQSHVTTQSMSMYLTDPSDASTNVNSYLFFPGEDALIALFRNIKIFSNDDSDTNDKNVATINDSPLDNQHVKHHVQKNSMGSALPDPGNSKGDIDEYLFFPSEEVIIVPFRKLVGVFSKDSS
jgi:hypothetical protein